MALVVYREQRIRSGTLCVTHYSAILFDLKMAACMGPETANSRDLAFYCWRYIVEISIQSTSETFFQSNCVLLTHRVLVCGTFGSVSAWRHETAQRCVIQWGKAGNFNFSSLSRSVDKINFKQIFESISSLMVFLLFIMLARLTLGIFWFCFTLQLVEST